MNENERIELEAENDGYRNEFQRAHAWSRMTTPIKNERNKANELVAQGKTVVLQCSPVYCRITDGILGESVTIVSVGDDYESAVGPVMNALCGESDEERYEVLPHTTTQNSVVTVTEDEIPF
jgi:hypothetical protein